MIQKTAIIGMGALGLLYADKIASERGMDTVTFIMDEERLQKYEGMEFDCNGNKRRFQMEPGGAAKPADLVIVAVKYNGLASALESIQKSVGEHTVILSVMNGISSEKILAERYGWSHIVDAVAQGMDAMKFENTLRYTRMGQLCIGIEREEQRESLERLEEFFREIRLPFVEEKDILHRLWGKFMLNVGVNQTCMAYETNYSGVLAAGSEETQTMLAAMREVIALANAEGIHLTEADVEYYIEILKTLSPEGMPSMRQDGVCRRYSEVEMFAGTVIELAGKHHLDVPVNRFLYQKIKEIEAGY